MPPLRTVIATRYVQPLREGGSLPAVVEADDGELYVAKFRGAGQGARALVAELVAGQLAHAAALPAPELVLVQVPPPLGRGEPDPEIQDILQGSHGVNVGLRYLDGAFNFDPAAAGELVSPELAARIVWFDALLTNPDRTHRNPNMLIWRRRPWLIDHGAAIYAHHDWESVTEERMRTPFPLIAQHVLLAHSGDLERADAALVEALGEHTIADVVGQLPVELLAPAGGADAPAVARRERERYLEYLLTRLRAPRTFVGEAERARERARREPPRRLSARR